MLDVQVDRAGDAYFIKPVFHGQEFFTLNKQQKSFVVTKGTGAGIFDAHYGLFHVRQALSDSSLRDALGDNKALGNRLILQDLDISAHLVSKSVTQEKPKLQVLFHSSHFIDTSSRLRYNNAASSSSGKRNGKSNRSGTNHQRDSLYNSSKFGQCMQIFINNKQLELTESCLLGYRNNVCIASVDIPLSWWDSKDDTFDLPVYYTVKRPHANNECHTGLTSQPEVNDGDANTASEASADVPEYLSMRRLVASVTLTHDLLTYQELKEDLNVFVYIPQRSFHPGSRLRIPIKLEVNSHLTSFEIKCVY